MYLHIFECIYTNIYANIDMYLHAFTQIYLRVSGPVVFVLFILPAWVDQSPCLLLFSCLNSNLVALSESILQAWVLFLYQHPHRLIRNGSDLADESIWMRIFLQFVFKR